MKTLISPRRQRTHDATVQSILDTARAIMREEGVEALSMHELARRMDMRAPSLYYYFSGKLEIYDVLFRLGFGLWRDSFERATRDAVILSDEMRIMLEGYMSFALENPDLYQLCFERPVPGFVPSEESLKRSFGALQDAIQRVEKHRDELDADLSSEEVVNLVIAVSHGLTAMHLANEPQLPMGQGRFGSLIPVALSMLEKTILRKGRKK
jgi:AcrR family transcriptional regulator